MMILVAGTASLMGTAGLDASAPRHPDVEQDHVGRGRGRELRGGHAVGRLADDLDVGVATEQHDQSAAEELLVVDHQDADGFTAGCLGHARIMTCARDRGMQGAQPTSSEITP
jgi:hypothetical protein